MNRINNGIRRATKKYRSWYKKYFMKETINMETGVPRIVAFDMFRGISIFVMLLVH